MISRLAKETIGKWKTEGLSPSFDDIVRLNDLGLKVEGGSNAFEFGNAPRISFLGDYAFHEPTVAKRMWLEQAMKLMKDDFQNQIALTAYALNTPSGELPRLDSVRVLVGKVRKFRDEVLSCFTETQILRCLEYALRGDEGDDDGHGMENESKDIPEGLMSVSRQLMVEALSYGIDDDVKYDVTLPQLERIVTLAALHSGLDVLKGEHA